MITELLKAINIGSIAWVERYGGLARTASIYFEGVGDKLYPVSDAVTERQLFEEGRYLDLVPNDLYHSVSYFEQLGDITLTPVKLDRRNKAHAFSVSLRFVCWLNLQKIGASETTIAYSAVLDVIKNLKQPLTMPGSSPLSDIVRRIAVSGIRVEAKESTRSSVFGKYSYAKDSKLFFYPYDYFSIKFNLSWVTPVECKTELALATPIDCIDLTVQV